MLYSINFLRFVAALGVVVFHASFSKFNIGQAGVDIFFVISGVVISYATPADERATKFFFKRFKRIMPMYWIATLAYVGFRWAAWGLLPQTHTLITSMLLIPVPSDQHWMPLYFPAWTLIFEMFFYGVFGLLLALHKSRAILIFAMLAFSATPPLAPLFAGTLNPATCLEFVFGILICDGIRRAITISRPQGIALVSIGVSLLAMNFYLTNPRPVAWGLPSAMIVAGMLSFEGSAWLKHPAIVLAGSASYSIYLFHETTIELAAEIAKRLHFLSGDVRPPLAVVTLSLAALIAGTASHLLIEKPLLGWLRGLRIAGRTAPLTQAVNAQDDLS